MDIITAGESLPTNPEQQEPDSGVMPQEQPAALTDIDKYTGLMDAAVARMQGEPVPVTPAPATASVQEKPVAMQDEEPVAPAPPVEPVAPVSPEVAPPEATPPVETIKLKIDGQEVEVPKERLVTLAQQGADYTRKTQVLAERARQIEAMEAVLARVRADPAFAKRFQSIFEGDDQQAHASQPQPEDIPPTDPIERLEWEITRKAEARIMARIQGQLAPVVENQQATSHAVHLNAFRSELQRDPLYPEAMGLVQQYVQAQPPVFRDNIYRTLDQNPQAFMQVYGQARAHLARQREAAPAAQPPVNALASAPSVVPDPATLQRTVTPRAQAPQLESAGPASAASTIPAAKAQEMKALRSRIKSNQSTGKDVLAYLHATGAIDRMTGGKP